jgi:hypothetical protein
MVGVSFWSFNEIFDILIRGEKESTKIVRNCPKRKNPAEIIRKDRLNNTARHQAAEYLNFKVPEECSKFHVFNVFNMRFHF